MQCRLCPECVHHPSALGWYECGLTGAQIDAAGDDNLYCPRNLPLTGHGNPLLRQIATSIVYAAHRKGKIYKLLAYYSPEAQRQLRELLDAALLRKRAEITSRIGDGRTGRPVKYPER